MNNIYVIGGANIDIFAKAYGDLIVRDSNPSTVTMSFGGVGRNIAANLTNFDETIHFVSCFANDTFGKMVYDACVADGFDMTYSFFHDDYPTSMYLAILDKNSDMYLASSDMRIVEKLDYEAFEKVKEAVEDDDYLVIDTNLDEEVIHKIYQNFKGIKVSDAISANKVHKLRNNLDRIDILKLNLIEAETLFNRELDSEEKIIAVLRALHAKGAKEVLITTKKGAYLASDKIYYYEHDAYDKGVQNTTGAGDAFLAAYINAHKRKCGVSERVCFALATAVLTVRSPETVADLSRHEVETFMRECHFKGGILYVF